MIIRLPVPISLNMAYRNVPRVGRVKTAAYKKWLIQADGHLLMQKRSLRPVSGQVALAIKIPAKTRGDVTNRIKLVEDYLVSREITPDDRHNWKVSIERSHEVDCCEVEITELHESV